MRKRPGSASKRPTAPASSTAPLRDPDRLAALRDLHLLDSPAEQSFDELTKLATRLLNVPVALVSLVDEDRQYFKSCIGLSEPWSTMRETPLSHSFCQHVVTSGKAFIINNARRNPLTRDNAAIPDLGVEAYAGIPLRTHDGHVLGTLCVIDHKPRRWSKAEIGLLERLATCVLSSIDLRAVAIEARRAEVLLRESEHRFRNVLSQVPAAVWATDRDLRITTSVGAALTAIRRGVDPVVGVSVLDFLEARDERSPALLAHRAALEGTAATFESGWNERLYFCRVEPLRDAGGAIVGVVGVAEDLTERRAAESALLASKERFDLFARATDDVLWDWDLRTGAVWWNQNFRSLFGHEVEHHADVSAWRAQIHPADIERVGRSLDSLIESGVNAWTAEYRVRRADGSFAEVYDRAFVLRDAGGAATRMIGTMIDVTERRRTERAVRESEALLRGVVDASLDAVIMVDQSGLIASWNPEAERIFGWPASEAVGLRIADTIIPMNDRADHVHGFARFIRTGEARILGQRIFRDAQRRDGSLVPVELAIVPVRVEGGWVFGAFIRDLSESRRVAAEQRRLTAILEGTTDFVGIASADGQLLYINRAGRRMLGLGDDEDLAGRSTSDLRPAWANELIQREGLSSATRDGSWSGETALLALDGRQIPVSQLILSHKDADGAVQHFSTIARDISGVQALQRQLAQAQKLEAIGRLAGGIAHDFNNLLTAIRGYTDLVLAETPTEDPRHADLREVRAGADRAADLTRQLMAFGRQQVLQPRVLDLNSIVADMTRMLSRLIGENIHLDVRPASSLGAVSADPAQLGQVLLNLVLNARDAISGGGKVTVTTREAFVTEDEARALGLSTGAHVVLEVSDTGSGMDEETRSRLFEPFFTTKSTGTGLGLATVYGIVRQSGGSIDVLSSKEAGSTFRVFLPSVHAAPVAPEVEAPVIPVAGHATTILLVEDESAVRDLTARVLARHGFSVLVASTGAQAVALAQSHAGPIDLLLTDMVMPGQSGREVAESVTGHRPGIRVIFMSGYTEDVLVRSAGAMPGTAFLSKPFTIAGLLGTVQRVLAQRTREH